MRVARGSLTVMKGIIKNELYTLIGQTVIDNASTVPKKDVGTTKLWHHRLGHISHRGLQELQKQGVLGNYKLTDFPFYEHYMFGKATRVKYAKAIHETQNQLDYIHSDLWGPSKVPLLGGTRYFLTLIDDYSGKVQIYFLKNKSDTFLKFKEWKILVETQVGRKVKKLRTDNGLKFLSNVFNSFCQQEGVHIELLDIHLRKMALLST